MTPRRAAVPLLALGLAATACASGGYASISPADVDRFRAEVAANPANGLATLRLASALHAAGDCDGAVATARRGMELRPQDAIGPLIVGECLESQDQATAAVAVYEAYTAEYPTTAGAPAVAARAMLAHRAMASEEARRLVMNEATLSAESADPNVLAVMPLEVIGDEVYAPLAFGLASMITSDLALVDRITLVERAQLDALLREFELVQAGLVTPSDAARAGRLLRAGRVAYGFTQITEDERMRLAVSLMDSDGRVVGSESVSGGLRDLFEMEKDLVLALIETLGYQLTQGERNAILENGTRSLAAFLAYSRGLLEQEAGNYAAATDAFAQAVRADPGFQQAREGHRVSSGAVAVQRAGGASVASLAGTTVSNPVRPSAVETVGSALVAGVQDVAPTLGEVLGGGSAGTQAAVTSTSTPPPSTVGTVMQIVIFGFRVVLVFR